MSKWARINNPDSQEIQPVLEVINYDPVGVITEDFLPMFKPCSDEVNLGYLYDPSTETFILPKGYIKHPDFETFGYVPS